MSAIRVHAVSKAFRRHGEDGRPTTLKSALVQGLMWRRSSKPDRFSVLDGVSFEVRRGAVFGVIGRNGAGKSTLLKMMAGIYRPDSGSIEVNGRLSALLELGVGFHPEYSGRDNVFLAGCLLGFQRKQIAALLPELLDFAEIGDHIDEPVRTYSSGMKARLGFALATQVDPEILLVDEVLAVGDQRFQAKCQERMSAFKRAGKTIVLVSHSAEVMKSFCDETIWIGDGRIRAAGPPGDVLKAYAANPD